MMLPKHLGNKSKYVLVERLCSSLILSINIILAKKYMSRFLLSISFLSFDIIFLCSSYYHFKILFNWEHLKQNTLLFNLRHLLCKVRIVTSNLGKLLIVYGSCYINYHILQKHNVIHSWLPLMICFYILK